MVLKAEANDGNHREPEKKVCRVLKFKHSEARKFFFKGETFFDLDLPPYFTFDRLLSYIDQILPSGSLEDWANVSKLRNSSSEELNHTVFNNRDGRYAWRPMQMVNPVLYVLLAREITEKSHWESIQKRFCEFSENEKIECTSLPVTDMSSQAGRDKGKRISVWWEEVEQRSIELALDYGNMIQTDITDCFGSIYTHSIAWAMHGKKKAQAKRNDKEMLGNIIDIHVQRICGRQTNGIPQGCPLMRFVAEMVLGYADLQLSEKIDGIKDYKILRFRDDYRIFTDNPRDGEIILKTLTETMIGLGMRLNPSKTLSTGEIIRNGAIKPDKLFWVRQKQEEEDLQKHLLIIHDLASRFPNSGSLARALDDYHKKIEKISEKPKNIKLLPLISIVADIAYNNPRTYAISCSVISKFLEWTGDSGMKREIKKIRKRFSLIPNTGHLEIWLQRITVTFERSHEYEEKLCELVAGRCAVTDIWDFDWIKNRELVENIKSVGIVDEEVIKGLPLAVSPKEIEIFKQY